MMMSVMSFAQWVAPSVADFFTPDTYAKEFKVSEAGADTTVYYLYNIEAGGFLSNNTCSNHAPWSTHAALKTTGNKIIVEKYIYTEIIQPEEGVEDAKADTIVHPWDGKTYTISNWGNYNNRGNKYYKIFPTSWSNMFVDHNTDPDYMWEIKAQGNGVYHISTAEVCSVWTNDSIARLFGVESYEGFLAFNAEDSRYLEDPTVMPLYPMPAYKLYGVVLYFFFKFQVGYSLLHYGFGPLIHIYAIISRHLRSKFVESEFQFVRLSLHFLCFFLGHFRLIVNRLERFLITSVSRTVNFMIHRVHTLHDFDHILR